MWRLRLLSIVLILGGCGLLAFAVHVELQLRARRGSGFRQWLSSVFYHSDVESYRNLTFHLLLFAPGMIVLGLGIWAVVSWRRRVLRARQIEQGLLTLSPAARKDILRRNLSGRRLAKELQQLRSAKRR